MSQPENWPWSKAIYKGVTKEPNQARIKLSTLRMIGENLKALEVAEEKAQQREEEYKKQIRTLSEKFKNAEARAEYGEKTVQKQNLRVDSIMFDLVAEKMKTQNVNDELDQTFDLFINQ